MLSGVRRPGDAAEGAVLRAPSRRTVLLGLLAATAVSWPLRPARSAPPVAVTNLRSYREALGMLAPRYRHALIDIRADWCGVCMRIEREVLPHPAVRRMLEDVALVKVDVTAMGAESRALLAHLRADGPPTLFVVDTATGAEYPQTRSVGSLKPRALIRRLQPFADARGAAER